jgi:hypothetical protein
MSFEEFNGSVKFRVQAIPDRSDWLPPLAAFTDARGVQLVYLQETDSTLQLHNQRTADLDGGWH